MGYLQEEFAEKQPMAQELTYKSQISNTKSNRSL
jgi:hypothetical protein